ncbi:MAG TPA: ABC transporter ATP-binding protein [Candidatus Margulisiibacteriota bacterium]|nr:ABC transporter ATP-binding protein [Candidatus Margulisiibacteriota bacterium]
MADVVIRVDNLGKKYRIGSAQPRYKSLRESIVDTVRAFPGLLSNAQSAIRNSRSEELWALADLSFEIKSGEVVGIIGRNGAGKSTLLKVLSRITEPSTGRVEIHGRVGSLLEVGTGFHPELTGRENIYLSGAILGMKRGEIARRFDQMVAFAEVERFIDTPVKHYSSGMYMRLAFTVAAHLEPEILLVDEVLAVGDSSFQRKCIGRMSDVAKAGRTVLFVSHNMAAIQNLCSEGLILDGGRMAFMGNVDQAINLYLANGARPTQATDLTARVDRRGTQTLRFTKVSICDSEGKQLETALSGQDIKIRFHYESAADFEDAAVNIAFNVYSFQGVLLTNLNAKDAGRLRMPVGRSGWFECAWPKFNLRSGVYTCALFCELNGIIVDWLQSAFQITVEDGDFFGTGSIADRSQGTIFVPHDWSSHVE